MISIERATELVDAWSGLDKWPHKPKAQAFLASTLAHAALDDAHAVAIIRSFKETCPRPKDIEAAGYRLGPKAEEVTDRLRREYIAEVRRALLERDNENLAYYSQQHPEIVSRVKRELGQESA